MLDPDGQGIILTNSTFFAFIDENEIIRNYSKPIPPEMTSSVYMSHEMEYFLMCRKEVKEVIFQFTIHFFHN